MIQNSLKINSIHALLVKFHSLIQFSCERSQLSVKNLTRSLENLNMLEYHSTVLTKKQRLQYFQQKWFESTSYNQFCLKSQKTYETLKSTNKERKVRFSSLFVLIFQVVGLCLMSIRPPNHWPVQTTRLIIHRTTITTASTLSALLPIERLTSISMAHPCWTQRHHLK